MRANTPRSIAVLVALALGLALAAPSVAGDRRLSARVAEPFELNGKLYPASSIVVEHVRDYTPSTSLSEVWVGSEFVGLLRADRVATPDNSGAASLSFERDARGTLALVGYASPAHGVHGEFRFQAVPAAAGPTPLVAVR